MPHAASSDLIDRIYAAAADPSRWTAFVSALSEACGGAAAAISLRIPIAGMPIHAARVGLLDEYAPLFPKHLQRGLPWGSLLLPQYTAGFAFGSEVLPDDRVAETDYYREYMQPQGLAAEGPLAHTFAEGDGAPLAAVVLYRRTESRRLDGRDLELCNTLVPHLHRAYRIHCELHGEHAQRRALAEVVDRLPIGVILVDGQQRCVMVSRRAQRIVERQDGLSIRENRPVAHSDRDSRELAQAIAATESSRDGVQRSARRSLAIERPSGARPLTVLVVPLADADLPARERGAVAALFVGDSDTAPIRPELLGELYGFTSSEARLVCELLTASSLEEAARRRGIQLSTARGYLKEIFQKTGARSQRDLVRLVLTGVGPLGSA
jgi:PAS domain-containing protein